MRSRSRLGRSFARERGAVIVYVAFFLGVLLSAATLAIDIGRLYNAQRELQRAANIAALDAASVSGGCYGNLGGDLQDSPLAVAQSEAIDSLARNGIPASYLSGSNAVQLGKMVSEDGIRRFEPLAAGEDVNSRTAVQIRLTRPTPQRILPLSQGPVMTATVAADSRPEATIRVGSGLANVSGGLLNRLLGALLGDTALNIDAVTFRGLFDASVDLSLLAMELGLGSVDELLDASTSLPLNDVLAAIDNVVEEDDNSVLDLLAATPGGLRNVTPGDVILAPLGIEGEGGNALVNAGELIMALAQTSNGTHAVNLPLNGLVNIPGLTNISARIAIVEPPRQKIFRAGEVLNPSNPDDYASTAQARIELSATLNVAGLVGVNLPLYVNLAKATAGLEEVHCARSGQPEHIVDVDTTTSIATLGIGQYSNIEAPSPTVTTANIVNVSALGIPIATIQAATLVDLGEQSEDGLEFEGPYSKTQSLSTNLTSAVTNGLDDLSSGLILTVKLLGIDLPLVNEAALANAVIAPLTAALKPVLNLLNPTVAGLLDGLGVSVGNAEVEVVSLTPVNRHGSDTDPDALSLQAFLFSH